MMKSVPVSESVGMVLCHDLTRIVPDGFKGPAFRKGHVVKPDDIPLLRDMGKEHLYVLDLEPGMLHENDAAWRIARAAAGNGIEFTDISEGRVNMKAAIDGLLKISVDTLHAINSQEGVTMATVHGNQAVHSGRMVAGTRIVPLIIEESRIETVESICAEHGPIIEVRPFLQWKIGMVTTGSEVFHGRIKDAFGPVVREKFARLGSQVIEQIFVSDDPEMTVSAIRRCIEQGADMVVCTGGMSVDPDDQTPVSIRAVADEVVTYGAPTFPGAMFMLAYSGDVPLLGLPGCVMYYKASIFELVVPRILAGEKISRKDIVSMGYGGFCAGCAECRYPICPFGKNA